jgi:uncharacterized repeat protein (TIGR03803 family)
MKTFFYRTLLCLAALWPAMTNAQTYTDLYGFSLYSGFPSSNMDGAFPESALVLSSNVLYGTTYEGGLHGEGVVFRVNADGTQFTNLHSFSALSDSFYGDNSDGAQPFSTLVLSSNVLYGTASTGGAQAFGTVFRLNTDGSDFTNLYSFPNTGGAPRAGLILSSNVLYGTAASGGTGGPSGYGAVFRINTDGSHFTNLYSFTALSNTAFGPTGGLILSGSTLYGTAAGGGSGIGGTIFSLGINGKNYTNLFNFEEPGGESQSSTNETGGGPSESLLLVGDTLYGTTAHGGTNGNGVVFSIHIDGSGFTNMHNFSQLNNQTGTNTDGYLPECQLLLIGGTLYGTTGSGGTDGEGTVFSINLDGSDFQTVYNFVYVQGPDYLDAGGAGADAGVIFSGSTLYGTTSLGGGYDGNVYSLNLSLSIPLFFQSSSGNLVLTWNNAAFSLQSSSDLSGSFATITNATSPYTVTPIGPQQFFRLQHN